MVNKLIVDGLNIVLNESSALPFSYTFSTAGVHQVKIGLDNTDEICAYAFKDCEDLTRVKFPSKITMIKRNAFENCTSLKSIDIPSTINYVGPNVFDGCITLSEINFEAPEPPAFYSKLSEDTTCYIPDGSKFIPVENYDDLVKDGSVQYYVKNQLGGYEEVDYEGLEEGTIYYYDNWTTVHVHENTIEERFRIPVTDIGFYDEGVQVTNFRDVESGTEADLFNFEISPSNATNHNVYWFSNNPVLASVDQNGHLTTAENLSGRATIYVCTEPNYNGSYVSAYLNVRVTNASGVIAIDPTLDFTSSSIDITNLDSFELPAINNPSNLPLTWSSDNEQVATVDNDGHVTLTGNNGTARIHASFGGNTTFNAKAAEYVITVDIPAQEKQENNISFSPNTVTLTLGDEFTAPTLSGANLDGATYTSSNTDVATVDASGHVEILAAGETTITVTVSENDDYNEGHATYTIIVNEATITPIDNHISFSPDTVTLTLGDEFTAPTLSADNLDGATYTSSNTDVATVDATGHVEILATGQVTIMVSVPANDEYLAANASYTIIVNSSSVDVDYNPSEDGDQQLYNPDENEPSVDVDYNPGEDGDQQLYNPDDDPSVDVDYNPSEDGDQQLYNEDNP